MKTIRLLFLLTLAITPCSRAQEARFFRISGPVPTTITALMADGTMAWTNAPTNATFTVQTATSLGGGGNWADYVKIPVSSGVNTNQLIDFNPPPGMVLIPAGSFTMGDTLDGMTFALPTDIYVSAFHMDANLVSSNQWTLVYNWALNRGYGFVNAGMAKQADHPVETVDWFDCVKWCNARSQQAGLTPVYYTDAGLTQVYTNGEVTVYANWLAKGYRLLTEAEWEKAARGGLSGLRFPWGDTIAHSDANYYSSSSFAYDVSPTRGLHPTFRTVDPPFTFTSPVGYFAPNNYGLYDMAGNVFAWCWDWLGTPYGQPTATNPTGPETGTYRMWRGGSWSFNADFERCAYRTTTDPSGAANCCGFRCVRGL